MKTTRFVTLEVEIETPDNYDTAEVEILIDELMEGAGFTFEYDSGEGTKVVGVTLQSYSDEEPA